MTRPGRRFPRQRPTETAQSDAAATDTAPPPAAVDTIDPLTLIGRAGPRASMPTLPAPAVGAAAQIVGVSQQWRMRLSEIGEAAGMTAAQEAEFHRMAESQQLRIKQEIPRLAEQLKPHFGTPGEGQARQRYEAGLRALKARLDEETAELLQHLDLRPHREPH